MKATQSLTHTVASNITLEMATFENAIFHIQINTEQYWRTRFTVSKEFDLAEGGEMNPHGDVRPHLGRQELQDLVLVETLLCWPDINFTDNF